MSYKLPAAATACSKQTARAEGADAERLEYSLIITISSALTKGAALAYTSLEDKLVDYRGELPLQPLNAHQLFRIYITRRWILSYRFPLLLRRFLFLYNNFLLQILDRLAASGNNFWRNKHGI